MRSAGVLAVLWLASCTAPPPPPPAPVQPAEAPPPPAAKPAPEVTIAANLDAVQPAVLAAVASPHTDPEVIARIRVLDARARAAVDALMHDRTRHAAILAAARHAVAALKAAIDNSP